MVDDFPKDIGSLLITAKYFDADNEIAWLISPATEDRLTVGIGYHAEKVAEMETPYGKQYSIQMEVDAPILYYWIDRNSDNMLMIELEGKYYYDAREVVYDEAGDGLNGNEKPWEMYPVSSEPLDKTNFSHV